MLPSNPRLHSQIQCDNRDGVGGVLPSATPWLSHHFPVMNIQHSVGPAPLFAQAGVVCSRVHLDSEQRGSSRCGAPRCPQAAERGRKLR